MAHPSDNDDREKGTETSKLYKIGLSIIAFLLLSILLIFWIIPDVGEKVKKSREKSQQEATVKRAQQGQQQAVAVSVKTMQYFDFPSSGMLALCLVAGADYYPIGEGGINVQYPDGSKTHVIYGKSTNPGYHDTGVRIITRDNPSVKGVEIWNYWRDSCK